MSTAQAKRPNLRSVALPAEHGGWGFLLEPILLALLVAPSGWGFLLGCAVISLFLLHQPLKIAAKDNLKRRRVSRTQWAERFALLYAGLGFGLLLIVIRSNGMAFMPPLVVGAVIALIQLAYDARNKSRAVIPELAGAFALATTASAMALLAGWEMQQATMLWVLLAARALTAIFYVRHRLRLAFKRPHNKPLVYALHIAAIGLFIILAVRDLIPTLCIAAIVLLTIRAFKGLSYPREGIKPKAIGFGEMGFGFAYTLIIAIGYWSLLL